VVVFSVLISALSE